MKHIHKKLINFNDIAVSLSLTRSVVAHGPNQVWSWDITQLAGPVKWTYYYLYVIIDIFSRYTVGWLVGLSQNANLAKQLIATTCEN